MISSSANPKIRQVAALTKRGRFRREQGLFVVEGVRMFQEALTEGMEAVYATESFRKQKDHETLLEKAAAKGAAVELVSEEVFKGMSDTRTPQGILALVRQRRWTLEDMLSRGKALLMILEGLQDPGNLGTILRSGEGAGVSGVIMDGRTADVYNPKVIRSTMGSIFRVPFLYTENLEHLLVDLKQRGIRLYAAHLEDSGIYDRQDYRDSCGFLIGNEAAGLTDETAALADQRVRIPMLGEVESLNAAVASSVLMYEAARQRRS